MSTSDSTLSASSLSLPADNVDMSSTLPPVSAVVTKYMLEVTRHDDTVTLCWMAGRDLVEACRAAMERFRVKHDAVQPVFDSESGEPRTWRTR